MRGTHRLAAACMAIAAITAINPAFSIAEPASENSISPSVEQSTSDFPELTPEQASLFEKYLEQDKEYQDGVDNSVTVSEEPPTQFGTSRTTSTDAVEDNRIGAVFFANSGIAIRTCTASHIGGKWWLTAYHCIKDNRGNIGFIEQSDGDIAGIENVYHRSENYDIALIKVGSGIEADKMQLSKDRPEEPFRYTISGYSGDGDTPHNYSSESVVKVISHLPKVTASDDNGHSMTFYDQTKVKARFSPTCSGDSGGPVWMKNVQYAVQSSTATRSAAKYYDRCTLYSNVANISPHLDWIEETMKAHSKVSGSEQRRAFLGGVMANWWVRDLTIHRLVSLSS